MRKYKKLTVFCFACILSSVISMQDVEAKEISSTVSVEKTELSAWKTEEAKQVKKIPVEKNETLIEKEQEEQVSYVVSQFAALKKAAALLEKQYQSSVQNVETMFLKYFVQRVYVYIEQANQTLVEYQQLLKNNPVEMQTNGSIRSVCELVLKEKDTLLEQLKAFNELKLMKDESVQTALTALEDVFYTLSTEQFFREAGEGVLQEMQYSNLAVKLHVQQTTYTCGMASVKMILDYWNITDKKGDLYKESTLWDWANSNDQGTYVYRVAQTLTHYGVAYEYKHMTPGKTDKTTYYRDIIQTSLEKNKPVIAQIRPDKNEYWEYSSGHYILVKGMYVDKEGIWQVIINDCHYKYPAQDKVIPLTELIQSVEKHSYYMVVGK